MTPEDAAAFVRHHGVVLASAKGPVPNLAEAIAGEPISGSWWSHPRSQAIYAILRDIQDASDILVCRIVKGKITFVHRRLWPHLIRMAHRFPAEHLAQIREEHTKTGRHATRAVAFSEWAAPDLRAEAAGLAEEDALGALGDWIAPARAGG